MRRYPRTPSAGLLTLGLLIVVLQMAQAEPVVRTLPNGLTVVVDEMHSSPVAAVRFYVRAGSAYEAEYLGGGIFHYIEHLLGKGSRSMTAEEIDNLQEALGNQTNAYTSYSHTCYHMVSAAKYVDQMIRMFSDYGSPPFHQSDIDTQRASSCGRCRWVMTTDRKMVPSAEHALHRAPGAVPGHRISGAVHGHRPG